MTNSTKPDAVCVCGHSYAEHQHASCFHEDFTLTDAGFKRYFNPCECDDFVLPDAPSPAHDTLAPQLRERIATLERENAELSRMVSLETNQAIEIGKLRAEAADLRARLTAIREELGCKQGYEITTIKNRNDVITDTDCLRQENGNLRDQLETLRNNYQWALQDCSDVRNELAALHTLADMAAGLLAEKGK